MPTRCRRCRRPCGSVARACARGATRAHKGGHVEVPRQGPLAPEATPAATTKGPLCEPGSFGYWGSAGTKCPQIGRPASACGGISAHIVHAVGVWFELRLKIMVSTVQFCPSPPAKALHGADVLSRRLWLSARSRAPESHQVSACGRRLARAPTGRRPVVEASTDLTAPAAQALALLPSPPSLEWAHINLGGHHGGAATAASRRELSRVSQLAGDRGLRSRTTDSMSVI